MRFTELDISGITALLIDPDKSTVTEIKVLPVYLEIRKVLGGDYLRTWRIPHTNDYLFVPNQPEPGFFKPETVFYFGTMIFVGCGLIMNGEVEEDVKVSIDRVSKMLRFPNAELRRGFINE